MKPVAHNGLSVGSSPTSRTIYNCMKIALCLSGQPRALQEGFAYHSRNLIEEYEVDVFVHSWNSDLNGRVLRIYKPVKHKFEDPKFGEEHDIKYKYTDEENLWPPRNALSAFYSIYQANELKRQHENENGFFYDWVIRSRFDYAINTMISFKELDNNKLYVPGRRDQLMCDQFGFSSSANMDKYADTYNHINRFYEENCWMIGEHLLAKNIINHGLQTRITHIETNRPFTDLCEAHAGLIRTDHLSWIK